MTAEVEPQVAADAADAAESPEGDILRLENIDALYGRIQALRDLSIRVGRGEIVTLIGANGAGKTTTLKTISGLQPLAGGRIRFGDDDVSDTPPHRRGVGMVFQSYALFPHLDVGSRSFRTWPAASLPGAPITQPPGCVPEPHW